MTLGEFKEMAQAAGFKVFVGSYCVDVSLGRKPCASIILHKFADSWVNTGGIDNEVTRAELISLVSEFANTPLTDRHERVMVDEAYHGLYWIDTYGVGRELAIQATEIVVPYALTPIEERE